jgi:hypothetical protein
MLYSSLIVHRNLDAIILHMNGYSSATRKCNYGATQDISMGPVTSAVALYITERIVTRIAKGQVFRKGVIRKLRRLNNMILEWHIIHEIVCDILEDC